METHEHRIRNGTGGEPREDFVGVRIDPDRRRGRGAETNRSGRFEPLARVAADDGWNSLDLLPPVKTEVQEESPRKIITRNESPDISFDRSINPYRGCEHGCAYCFARPTHAYMGLSPGLDFETKLFAKPNAAKLLEKELAKPGYEVRTMAIGTNTDPYQPIERRYRIMREILEVLDATSHPVGIVTKSALVVRDIDILSAMAKRGLVKVALSVTTLDRRLARAMEPRAATPDRRLETLRLLSEAGIPTTVMVAPVIPALNEAEIERILEAAAQAGVREAGYVLLRLPLEVKDVFKEFLEREYPDRAKHVMSVIRSMRGGKEYDSAWGERMRGNGPYAWQIGRRFEIAAREARAEPREAEAAHGPVHAAAAGKRPARPVREQAGGLRRYARLPTDAGIGIFACRSPPEPQAMTPTILVSAFVAGATYTLIPGPAFLALLGIGAAAGRRAGAGFVIGHLAGDIVWSSLSLIAIIGAHAVGHGFFDGLGLVCGLYLVWLGANAMRAKRDESGRLTAVPKRPMLRGLTFGLTNPKGYPVAIAMFTALLSSSADKLSWGSFPELLGAAFVGFLVADVILVSFAGASWVRSLYRRYDIWIARASGLIFIGFGLHALYEAAPGLLGRRD